MRVRVLEHLADAFFTLLVALDDMIFGRTEVILDRAFLGCIGVWSINSGILEDHGGDRLMRYRRGLEVVIEVWNFWMLLCIQIYLNDHAPIACRVAGEDVLEDLAVCVSHMISAQDVQNSA